VTILIGSSQMLIVFRLALLACVAIGGVVSDNLQPPQRVESNSYGIYDDYSWAIRSQRLSNTAKQVVYDEFLQGCKREALALDITYGRLCQANENARLDLNKYQPSSMRNYTSGPGFLKTRAPDNVWALIQKFWKAALEHGGPGFRGRREWDHPTPYHNTWDAPTTVVLVEEASELTEQGPDYDIETRDLMEVIWRGVRDVAQEWTGQQLIVTSVYGIRLYHNQSILAPHVDRLPLVTSAIINVAQQYGGDEENSEPWPLEVYDRQGFAHNITMNPGDLVLYESHSTIHGRPFPFKGDYFANIFVHFQPIGSLVYTDDDVVDIEKAIDIPPYIIPGSLWEKRWRADSPVGWQVIQEPGSIVQRRDLDSLRYLVDRYYRKNPNAVTLIPGADEWLPLHEAIRQNSLEIVKYLVDGSPKADVNAIIEIVVDPDENDARQPYTPLGVAMLYHGKNHPITDFLLERSNGSFGSEIEVDEDGTPLQEMTIPHLNEAWADRKQKSEREEL
jgi:prolyl 4-hydroxylase